MIKKIFTIIVTTVLPLVTMAQLDGTDAVSFFASASKLINGTLIPLFVTLALAYVIYAVVMFIAAGDDTKQKDEKKQQIFWGVIGLFVIVSIWGLVGVVQTTLHIGSGGVLDVRN